MLHRLFTVYRKNPEISAGNFQSVKTVPVVYHLPKISESSRRARRDSSYNINLVRMVNGKRISTRNVPIAKMGLPFQNFRPSREFPVGRTEKKRLPFTSQPEFPGIRGKMVNIHKLVLFK